ncbi:metallophosphoesterase family protein [Shimia sp. R11_0]|uniref:metallophosphoesterase family protein n=1 Tax=Shimia sp. R11_0 TaxID=2821096 RepID=UPI001ADCD93D|nr:metallophosphoesterase family protein [Shimia sp. R11_0]MBO9477253.1 metallophosphoesterase family protein [Shimia sp. R11_0]
MKFAVLADIHGNALALQAVLQDMQSQGVSEAVNLGDFFSGPLQARDTADMLMAQDFPSIRGNHDRILIEQPPEEMGLSDRAAFDQLSPQHLQWIKALPATRTVFEEVFLCHGTPSSDTAYWLERVEDTGTVRAAKLAEVLKEAEEIYASLILCGHTHIPRVQRLPDGRTILNPGSVGCPAYDDIAPAPHHMQTGTPNASYAIVEKQNGQWITTFRSIPYASDAASAYAAQNGRHDWAHALKTGWFES